MVINKDQEEKIIDILFNATKKAFAGKAIQKEAISLCIKQDRRKQTGEAKDIVVLECFVVSKFVKWAPAKAAIEIVKNVVPQNQYSFTVVGPYINIEVVK